MRTRTILSAVFLAILMALPAGAGPVPGDLVPQACPFLFGVAPVADITAALEMPAQIAGWGQLQNPGAPESRFNTRRTWLSIRNPSVPYHRLFNGLIFHSSCWRTASTLLPRNLESDAFNDQPQFLTSGKRRALPWHRKGWTVPSITSPLAKAVSGAAFGDRVFVFSIDEAGVVSYQAYEHATGAWTLPSEISPASGFRTNVVVAATATDSSLYLFAKDGTGPTGNIVMNTSVDGTVWSGWTALPAGDTAFGVAAVARSDGQVFIFRTPLTGTVNYTILDAGTFSPWAPIPGDAATSLREPSAAYDRFRNRVALYTVAPSSDLAGFEARKFTYFAEGWTNEGATPVFSPLPIAVVKTEDADSVFGVMPFAGVPSGYGLIRVGTGTGRVTPSWEVAWNNFAARLSAGSAPTKAAPAAVPFDYVAGGTGHVMLLVVGADNHVHYVVVTEIRLAVVQAKNDDGSRGTVISRDEVKAWVNFANAIYDEADIRFVFAPELDWFPRNNTKLNGKEQCNPPKVTTDCIDVAVANAEASTHPGRITVIFRHGQQKGATGLGWSWESLNFVVMPEFKAGGLCGVPYNFGLLAHELGHYLSLRHTFISPDLKGVNVGSGRLALKDNRPIDAFDNDALVTGHEVSDTPPDPGVGVVPQCADTSKSPESSYQTQVTLNQGILCVADTDCSAVGGVCRLGYCQDPDVLEACVFDPAKPWCEEPAGGLGGVPCDPAGFCVRRGLTRPCTVDSDCAPSGRCVAAGALGKACVATFEVPRRWDPISSRTLANIMSYYGGDHWELSLGQMERVYENMPAVTPVP